MQNKLTHTNLHGLFMPVVFSVQEARSFSSLNVYARRIQKILCIVVRTQFLQVARAVAELESSKNDFSKNLSLVVVDHSWWLEVSQPKKKLDFIEEESYFNCTAMTQSLMYLLILLACKTQKPRVILEGFLLWVTKCRSP